MTIVANLPITGVEGHYQFLAATGLKLDECEKLLPAFQTAYEKTYPPELTPEGKTRQRQIGGGATGALPKSEDKLFFILV